jgi:hypothetical protein
MAGIRTQCCEKNIWASEKITATQREATEFDLLTSCYQYNQIKEMSQVGMQHA